MIYYVINMLRYTTIFRARHSLALSVYVATYVVLLYNTTGDIYSVLLLSICLLLYYTSSHSVDNNIIIPFALNLIENCCGLIIIRTPYSVHLMCMHCVTVPLLLFIILYKRKIQNFNGIVQQL